MPASISMSHDRQIIFCGLEILRLMREQIENRQEIDRKDIQAVLDFMRDVAHPCLDNAETLLRPARTETDAAEQSQAIDAALSRHADVRALFVEMTRAADPSAAEEFAAISSRYSDYLAGLLAEERRLLPKLVRSFASGKKDGDILDRFMRTEREIRSVSRRHDRLLHQLEVKYTAPHCI